MTHQQTFQVDGRSGVSDHVLQPPQPGFQPPLSAQRHDSGAAWIQKEPEEKPGGVFQRRTFQTGALCPRPSRSSGLAAHPDRLPAGTRLPDEDEEYSRKKEREIPKNVSKRARARLAWSSSRAEGGNRPLKGTHLNSSNSAAKFGR